MASKKGVLTKKDYVYSILRSYVLQDAQNYGTMPVSYTHLAVYKRQLHA